MFFTVKDKHKDILVECWVVMVSCCSTALAFILLKATLYIHLPIFSQTYHPPVFSFARSTKILYVLIKARIRTPSRSAVTVLLLDIRLAVVSMVQLTALTCSLLKRLRLQGRISNVITFASSQ